MPSSTWFLHEFIHILTQQALVEHLPYARHCSWRPSAIPGLMLVGSEWERQGRAEGAREGGIQGFLPLGSLPLSPPNTHNIYLGLRR